MQKQTDNANSYMEMQKKIYKKKTEFNFIKKENCTCKKYFWKTKDKTHTERNYLQITC